jgi:hypothetical protein
MSDRLQEMLDGSIAPGLYRWSSRADATRVAARAERAGWRCFHLDGRRIADKATLLSECALVMGFPAYFGRNWDALDECLRDLSWTPAKRGYLLLFDDASRLAGAYPDDWAVALDVLRRAVEHWRASARPMAVLLRRAGPAGRDIPRL